MIKVFGILVIMSGATGELLPFIVPEQFNSPEECQGYLIGMTDRINSIIGNNIIIGGSCTPVNVPER